MCNTQHFYIKLISNYYLTGLRFYCNTPIQYNNKWFNYNKNIAWLGKCDKNGFLNVFSTGNLLNSRQLWQYRACAKERKRAVKMSTQKFSTRFNAKDIDFLHFSGVSCQKRIEMNIEWIRMAIPVLISKPLNQSFDNTVYRSRPLL